MIFGLFYFISLFLANLLVGCVIPILYNLAMSSLLHCLLVVFCFTSLLDIHIFVHYSFFFFFFSISFACMHDTTDITEMGKERDKERTGCDVGSVEGVVRLDRSIYLLCLYYL